MPWNCERCHHLNLGLPDDESTSLLHEDEQVLTCEACGHRSVKPESVSFSDFFSSSGPSLLATVDAALSGFSSDLHNVSDDNMVEILDTPHMWEVPFDQVRSKIAAAAASVVGLAKKMEEIIAYGRQVIDIVSLGVPANGDVFETAILNGIEEATKQSDGRVVIRLLFGYVPTRDGFLAWRDRLLTQLKSRLIGKNAPQLFYGQLATTTTAAKVLVSTEFWNHAKIIAADGVAAIVGGHNFAEDAYAIYPMAHDVSVRVVGQAAAHAQAFCDYMWNHNQLGASQCFRLVQTTAKNASTMKWDEIKTTKTSFVCYSESSSASSTSVSRPPRVDPTKAESAWSRDIPKTHPFGTIGPKARIMTLGRGLPGDGASNEAKITLIKAARKSIRLCQQDLVFLGTFAFAEKDHDICHALAHALLCNPHLTVQVVVSPPRGWAGGDPYSWGAGAKGTYELLAKILHAKVSAQTAAGALTRLFVAPFCFTTAKFKTEEDYLWPHLGSIARPFPTGSACVPMPGNHSKVFFVDDTVAYVGSDNLYPNVNLELGYLIEGEAVSKLLEEYWAPVWWHSSPRCYLPT